MLSLCITVFVVFIAFAVYPLPNVLRFYGYGYGGKVTRDLNATYDYIVVGGGTTGSVVAARLSENPNIRVLLLEAGEEETVNPMYFAPGAGADHFGSKEDWAFPMEPQERFQLWRSADNKEKWKHGRLLGGSSTINALQYNRGSKRDYDKWEKQGCEGWGYEDVLPFFKKSEDMQTEFPKEPNVHGKGGFLGVTEQKGSKLTEDFIAAGQELGYDHIDYNSESEIGFSYFYSTTKDAERSSPVRHLLRKAMLRSNLHVCIHAFVTKVTIDAKRATGVEVNIEGQKLVIKATREVIVSAGTVMSPKLLMLSGIGPKDDLNRLKIPVVADVPVGRNLESHIGLVVWSDAEFDDDDAGGLPGLGSFLQYVLFRSGLYSNFEMTGIAYVNASREGRMTQINVINSKVPFHLFGLANPEIDPATKGPGLTFLAFLLHPEITGSIKLRSADPFEDPIINPNYFTNETDIQELIHAIRVVEKMVKSKAFGRYNMSIEINKLPSCAKHEPNSDAYWHCYIEHMGFSGLHHTATCKMGSAEDPTAVVDPKLRVRGVRGLRVMDASVIPISLSGNSMAPCLMVGEKGAAMILEELEKQ